MTEHIIDELTWRGLIAQSTDIDALRAALSAGLSVYAGFDPTADSLHAGNLVPLLMLRRLQKAGNRPIVLAGGATGQIGDPRDVGERTLASPEVVAERLVKIRKQLELFVDFDDSPTGAKLVNNLDWTSQISAIDFLRDVGKHFSVNVMLNRETVKRRLATDGMSYTEFSYLLLQSNDFRHLYKTYGATLQVGGSDQWGNIIGGVDLIRRTEAATTHALTVPLVTDEQGRKFGKSTGGGNIWLDPEMTSPYAWYQNFVNTSDETVIKYLRMFTFLAKDEIDALKQDTIERPHLRAAQKALAAEFTTLVHGGQETANVIAASAALFGKGEFRDLPVATLRAAISEAPTGKVALADSPTIVDLLTAAGLVDSKGAARRAVKEGGAYVNNVKVTDETWTPRTADLLGDGFLIVRKGKRSIAGIEVAH